MNLFYCILNRTVTRYILGEKYTLACKITLEELLRSNSLVENLVGNISRYS